MLTKYNNIFDYIVEQETLYATERVHLADNWDWNMKEHIERSFLVKNSKFWKGNNDGNRPFRNIVLPILNVAYRSEGFDVKDIVPYVNHIVKHFKSFLVKHFHPSWARKNKLDTFIDEMVESFIDYGLALIKNVNDRRPEVVPLQQIAFCDQTDILSGPLGLKHNYSPDQLMDMSGKWYADKVKEAIEQSLTEKSTTTTGEHKTKTPGKYIEVYEVHGNLPAIWLNKEAEKSENGEPPKEYEAEYDEDDGFVSQVQIVAFYTGASGNKEGICLFKGRERKPRFKAVKRDAIFGRACGRGAIEELFEPQTWTNYSAIQIKEMLDIATAMISVTDDPELAERNNMENMDKGEIVEIQTGKTWKQMVMQPYNKAAFDDASDRWERNARNIGSADEALLGESPAAGTPFALQALMVQEGRGIHDYRRGKVATFVGDELYPDWILDYLVRDINKGHEWLEDLDSDELQEVADSFVRAETRRMLKDMTVKGRVVMPEEKTQYEAEARESFLKGGTKKFLKMLKEEVSGIPISVHINVAGKQKDLKEMADKLTNIFREVIANPQILQNPAMAKLFNEILESSGFSPLSFAGFTRPAPGAQGPVPGAPPGAMPEGMEEAMAAMGVPPEAAAALPTA